MPRALIITTAGINCDLELAEAFALAGAEPTSLHLNQLLDRPERLDEFDLVGLPGGFSYGDAVAAGRVAAAIMRERLYPALVRAVQRGVPMIAPCNGFQMAVQIGLLPGPPIGAGWPPSAPRPSVALGANRSGRYIDCWVGVEVPADTRCVWTAGLEGPAETMLMPIAHAEGRFTVGDDATLARLADSGQVAVRYASDDNPNGSLGDVAGICDATGLVLGLMPHPERYTRWTQHPWWTRLAAPTRQGDPPGLAMFSRAVAHATAARPVGR
ncbi:MAG: phosphoribosylformylglycinamidine synthase subunit PurQ [Planctomycetota bacterium]|jgi:phosphoribosylformylglycinamidine synthase